MSQQVLGDKLGISKNSICKWETGKSYIHRSKIDQLAKFLGVTPAYLLGADEKPTATIDDESAEMLQALHDRAEMKTLFSVAKGATKEQIETVATILEVMKNGKN